LLPKLVIIFLLLLFVFYHLVGILLRPEANPIVNLVLTLPGRKNIKARTNRETFNGANWDLVYFSLKSQICFFEAYYRVNVAHQAANYYECLAATHFLLREQFWLSRVTVVSDLADQAPVRLNALEQNFDLAVIVPDLERIFDWLFVSLIHLLHRE
jgi:hypothetical protein